jgi:hypothetical protein
VTQKQAQRFVRAVHRHSGVPVGDVLRVGLVDDAGLLRGVAMAEMPKAHPWSGTLEVSRVCTDGIENGCSMLYGALRRAAKALGYQRLITYTRVAEDGASLKASGWTLVGETGESGWHRHVRGRRGDVNYEGPKNRWEIELTPDFPEVHIPQAQDHSDQLVLA